MFPCRVGKYPLRRLGRPKNKATSLFLFSTSHHHQQHPTTTATSTSTPTRPSFLDDGLTLQHFLNSARPVPTPKEGETETTPPLSLLNPVVGTAETDATESNISLKPSVRTPKSYYLETYGCQMNVSDTEIVSSILYKAGYKPVPQPESADVILVNTCAIRDNAEQKVWRRLDEFKAMKKTNPRLVGVLGCMAERLKTKLLESDKMVDVVVGPDAYRDLPRLLSVVGETGESMSNTLLSLEETYSDIAPVRSMADIGTQTATEKGGISAFVTIMRGCDNMCSFCIVPHVRGRERSRDVDSILEEVRELSRQGYKEVTLLGQNVNSYNFHPGEKSLSSTKDALSPGFKNISRRKLPGVTFTELLRRVSDEVPHMRIRFTSPHPKDFPLELLTLMQQRPNLCKQIHAPVQSGNTKVLERMRRGYTREAYLDLVGQMRAVLGENLCLSTDVIAGFCGESEEEHRDTVSLMREVKYDQAFMFAYSQREKTHAHRNYPDDVSEEVKSRRLSEIIETFRVNLREKNQKYVGTIQLVLLDGHSRKQTNYLTGRTDGNKRVMIADVPLLDENTGEKRVPVPGDFIKTKLISMTGGSFVGMPITFSSLTK